MPEPPIPQSKIRSGLIKYAAFCLSRRPYFEETIRHKLSLRSKKLGYGHAKKVIDSIIKNLKKGGYLDDLYLAQAFVRRQLSKGYGPKIIILKLRQLNLNEDMLNLALQEADMENQVSAIDKYAKKYNKLDRRKLISRLFSRGFSLASINKLFDSGCIED